MKNLVSATAFFLTINTIVGAGQVFAATDFHFETRYDDFTDEPEHFFAMITTDTSFSLGNANVGWMCSKEMKVITADVGIHLILDEDIEVKYRVDKMEPVSGTWHYNGVALSFDLKDFNVIYQILEAELLVIQVRTETARFDVAGGREKVKKFLDACAPLSQ